MTAQTRRRITSGSLYEEQIGYSRAVRDGRWVFVSGTTGFDYRTMEISSNVVEQCRQALANIDSALREANSSFEDVVRVTYIFPEPTDFEKCWSTLKARFHEARPAATMYSARLADPRMKVEIEVTAKDRTD